MTLDIRAKVFCDKGTVISGGFSDDHVQGTGLIRTRGEVVLDGLVTLLPGDTISLGYEKGSYVVNIPRALRVLSSFADPFRRQTTVSVGCKLTLLENLRENIVQSAEDDPANEGIPCEELARMPINMSFNFIASTCLAALGIVTEAPLSLEGSVAIGSFDYSAGYVQILSDILYSQSKVGYLNASEQLAIVDLSYFSGTIPVYDEDDVIDVSPIRSGDIPADVVLVEYSYNRFKKPDPDEVLDEEKRKIRDWELDITQGEAEYTYIWFNDGDDLYTVIHHPLSTARTTYDEFDRAIERVEERTTYGAKINSAYVTELLEETGGIRDNTGVAVESTVTTWEYLYPASALYVEEESSPCSYRIGPSYGQEYDPERDDPPTAQVTLTYASDLAVAGAIGFQTYFYPDGELHPGNAQYVVQSDRIEYQSDEFEGLRKEVAYHQKCYAMTVPGQQGLSRMAEEIDSVFDADAILSAGAQLVNTGISVSIKYDRYAGTQKRPSLENRVKEEFYKDPRESVSRTEYIYGSEGINTTTTYNMPWAPDDEIEYRAGQADPYLLKESNAVELARKFGQVQQQLTYGHRMGFAVQTVPDKLPSYGASLITLSFGGILAEYLVNGQSWSFDSNGIVTSADMLYLGGVGATTEEYRTPSPWSPVQSGITQLPLAPEITTNPEPAPANSIETPVDFDANNPGDIFESIPKDTAPVYENVVEVTALVPPYQTVVVNNFTTFLRSDVTRTLIFLPLEDREAAPGTRIGVTVEQYSYAPRDTDPSVMLGTSVTKPDLADRSASPAVYVGSSVEVEAGVQFTLQTTTAAPLAGASQTTSTPSGWTEVFSGSVNNDSAGATRWEMTGLPFDFVIDGGSYTSFWLYPSLTLGFGSNISFTTPSTTVPAQPKLHVYARRVQYVKKVYSKITANTYRVRVEATETSTSFPRVVEIAFFDPALFSGRTIVEVRVGVNGTTSDFFNAYSASAALGSGLASKPNNSSYVFESLNGTGTSWSLTKDRHVTPVE